MQVLSQTTSPPSYRQCAWTLLQIARYMTQLRQNRLERVQNKQDDEVVGIAGLYLTVTLVILLMAALANLPI